MKITRREALRQMALNSAVFGAAPFLVNADTEPAKPQANKHKVFPIREIYCPAHFGNSYEAMWPSEMRAYLAELKWWGFNRYSDWITTTDVRNPYQSDAYWDLATEQLDRKKKAFRAAQDLGLELNLILTANHVYLDQLRPELAAVKSQKIAGQLLCPSKPEARKIILQNAEKWFSDLASAGLRFNALTLFAYDYGGCGCEKCKPWIVTFARLSQEIHAVAKKHHPDIEPWFCSWWWTPDEHALINEWAAKEAPHWLKAITLHIEYGQTGFKDVAVPDGCQKIAFIHNGYADTRQSNDIYAKWGAVIAPNRLPGTLRHIEAQGATGFQAYSEGVFDDVNKAILAGMSSGRFENSSEALAEYAKRYFSANQAKAEAWASWLGRWGDRKQVQLTGAASELLNLSENTFAGWRLDHWRSKLTLETLDRQIGAPKENEWTAEKLRLVDEFWAEQEHLQRDIYRLGPVRHVFARRFCAPAWYDSWQKATQAAPKQGAMRPEA